MAIALIANNKQQGAAGGGGVTNGASINSTGANFIVVVAASYQGTAEPTLTDSKGNTWTARTAYSRVGDQRVRIYYAENPSSVGASHTFSYGGAATYASICVAAFSGVATSTAYDGVENGATSGAATSLAAGSVTPSQNNCLIIYGTSPAVGETPTITVVDTGGATDTALYSGGNAYGASMAYGIQTTATARNPAWSWTTGASCISAAAVFRAAAAASVSGHRVIGGGCFGRVIGS